MIRWLRELRQKGLSLLGHRSYNQGAESTDLFRAIERLAITAAGVDTTIG